MYCNKNLVLLLCLKKYSNTCIVCWKHSLSYTYKGRTMKAWWRITSRNLGSYFKEDGFDNDVLIEFQKEMIHHTHSIQTAGSWQ